MKPAFSAIGVSLVLGLTGALSGRPLDIYDYVVVIFATSIVVWTFEQYDRRKQH
ncbi:MAG TPA: hypothetical protein VL200_01725 [Lacunisphaera sp.]|jgi:hypothetical protein|nr:hypothetical protein [Lacunisphaera sp.]